MRTTAFRFALPALLLAACTATGGEQGQLMQSDIQRLDRQVRELRAAQQGGSEATRRLETLERSVQQLNQQLAQLQRTQADITARYEGVRQEQMNLTGRLEESRNVTQRLQDDQELLRRLASQASALDGRIKQLEQELANLRTRVSAGAPGNPPGGNAQSQGSPQARPPQSPPTAQQQAEAVYREGFDFMNKSEFGKARDRFQAFLKAAPNSEFAEGAMYLIAETYYREKDYENAILRYEELVARYPKGRRVPAARLYQGYAFKELGAPKDARALFERVVTEFPNSTEAQLARAEIPKLQ
jgi:tol-pal system protein YbgF